MPSQPADTASACHTRASNATAHPTEEVAAAQEEKVAQAAAQAVAAKAGAEHITGIELEMDAKQVNMLMRKAKEVWSYPIPSKGKKAMKDGLSQAAACGGGDEVGTNLN
ncbi:uncharacterized protein F5147DRAFT_655357 [Suillus discolor]|uniref:Uncharacterized protein n=1 Tax=Suillus discolor TaxID=1912936 RepID=A0A9P7F125_9AGAM|nr:uncharacterized protein F5147DRAFT_655357 [Suillus discolor]KAG2101384.1 hypothetical protein F5147DRAFT_655357 [Suillus discolor]